MKQISSKICKKENYTYFCIDFILLYFMQASNRIIVNTLVQYARTILNMLLSLYSSRLVLDILGVDDYGIYVLVAGVVSMLSFFTNSLVSSTQRFLSYGQGKKNMAELKAIFSNSLLLHIALGFIVMVVLEAITPLLFNGFLKIPSTRLDAAVLIYQQVVLMVYLSFVTSPYRALLVSRENITYASIIDVLDGVLKVALVIALQFVASDKLEVYGWMMTAICVFNLLAFSIYSHAKYEECIRPRLSLFDLGYLKSLAKYTGWVTYSALSIALRNQGLAIVLNRALGTAINAAYGIGMQISGMISFINISFSNAVSPQLTAAEGVGDRERMWRLAIMGSKIPFLLLAMIGIPTMFEMQTLLELWLVKVPENTMLFGCTFLAMAIVDQLTTGLMRAKFAIGKIGSYVFLTCTPKLLLLPFSFWIFYIGGNVEVVCGIMFLIELICVFLRFPPLMKEKKFDALGFIKEVMIYTLPPVCVSVLLCYVIFIMLHEPYRLLATYPISVIAFVGTAYLFSLNPAEKNKVNTILKKILKR